MPVSLEPPQLERRRRRRESYPALFDALTAQRGDWASLPLEEVAGNTPNQKQTTIWCLARLRGLRVQTTVQDGRVYARIVETKPKGTANAY